MMRFLEQLLISCWNKIQGRRKKAPKESASALTLGFRVVEGEVTKQRIIVSQTRRTTHCWCFGRTGSGKSYWVKQCAALLTGNAGFCNGTTDVTPIQPGKGEEQP